MNENEIPQKLVSGLMKALQSMIDGIDDPKITTMEEAMKKISRIKVSLNFLLKVLSSVSKQQKTIPH